MRIDEVGECVGETEISRPDGALRGRSEEPEVGAFLYPMVARATKLPLYSSVPTNVSFWTASIGEPNFFGSPFRTALEIWRSDCCVAAHGRPLFELDASLHRSCGEN
jgi:hypothetical protein